MSSPALRKVVVCLNAKGSASMSHRPYVRGPCPLYYPGLKAALNSLPNLVFLNEKGILPLLAGEHFKGA